MSKLKNKDQAQYTIRNHAALIKPVCHNCMTLNPKGTASYKCAVHGECPGLPPSRDCVSPSRAMPIKIVADPRHKYVISNPEGTLFLERLSEGHFGLTSLIILAYQLSHVGPAQDLLDKPKTIETWGNSRMVSMMKTAVIRPVLMALGEAVTTTPEDHLPPAMIEMLDALEAEAANKIWQEDQGTGTSVKRARARYAEARKGFVEYLTRLFFARGGRPGAGYFPIPTKEGWRAKHPTSGLRVEVVPAKYASALERRLAQFDPEFALTIQTDEEDGDNNE